MEKKRALIEWTREMDILVELTKVDGQIRGEARVVNHNTRETISPRNGRLGWLPTYEAIRTAATVDPKSFEVKIDQACAEEISPENPVITFQVRSQVPFEVAVEMLLRIMDVDLFPEKAWKHHYVYI